MHFSLVFFIYFLRYSATGCTNQELSVLMSLVTNSRTSFNFDLGVEKRFGLFLELISAALRLYKQFFAFPVVLILTYILKGKGRTCSAYSASILFRFRTKRSL
jgi:hypothetical protein